MAELRRLLTSREPLYAEADETIDTSKLGMEQVSRSLIAGWPAAEPCRAPPGVVALGAETASVPVARTIPLAGTSARNFFSALGQGGAGLQGGYHSESGRYTMDDWLRIDSDHVGNHSDQIDRPHEAWSKSRV